MKRSFIEVPSENRPRYFNLNLVTCIEVSKDGSAKVFLSGSEPITLSGGEWDELKGRLKPFMARLDRDSG